MNTFIGFIMGPMVWISLSVCLFGLVFKVVRIIREINAREHYLFSYISLKHSLRSIGAWLIPFFPKSTRIRPLYYAVSYLFHLLLFILPLFVMSHVVLFNESFQVALPALNDRVADLLTLAVIGALVFFALRRRMVRDVRYLTSWQDYVLLLVVALPFVSGFLAYHQVDPYRWMVVFHVLSGEFVLIFLPFSKFAHMVTAPLTRAYMGSEFGKVRHARDW
ncbi:MAG: nitrate reductase [Desulfobacteraceae bacterium]